MKYQFGEKIRSIREKRELKLKEVALKAGVSESLISQIERNKISPAIDTLMKIAEILEIDLDYLFEDYKVKKQVNLVKKIDRKKISLKNITYEQLSKTISGNNIHDMEAYYMKIEVGGETGSQEYGHMGKELGIILKGKGTFTIGNEEYQLEAGDSLSFESDVPHLLKNTGDTLMEAYWVITPPKNEF